MGLTQYDVKMFTEDTVKTDVQKKLKSLRYVTLLHKIKKKIKKNFQVSARDTRSSHQDTVVFKP